MTTVAIVGAGPGGLMTARLLEQKCGAACSLMVFEAAPRVGGKLHTRRFSKVNAAYESGVAECYGYVGSDDPLRALLRDLGLDVIPTTGSAVVMDGQLICGDADLARIGGPATRAAVESFRAISAQALSVGEWSASAPNGSHVHPAAALTGAELLELVDDDVARRYLALLAHSDLASEPHQTSALYALRKMVMGLPGYGTVYTIAGGMEELPRRLARELTRTRVELNARVMEIARDADGYSLGVRRADGVHFEHANVVVLALPHGALYAIKCAGDELRQTVGAHIAAYDRPGHYLRISLLFDSIFWRDELPGSWFMLDAFGGCCVYDESARHGHESCGVLGWLIPGAQALMLCNADDATLAEMAIASLPPSLVETARRGLLEWRVHRWAGAVSARPGGSKPAGAERLLLDRSENGGLCVVGDYLFDATLNGVLRSASLVTDMIARSLTSGALTEI